MMSQKSPLHPSALRLRDLRPGRRIIRFNIGFGVMGRLTVVADPYVSKKDGGALLKVRLCDESGHRKDLFLADMGVVPYEGCDYWNNRNLTIDARKEHLLPSPDPKLIPPMDDLDDFWDYDLDDFSAYPTFS